MAKNTEKLFKISVDYQAADNNLKAIDVQLKILKKSTKEVLDAQAALEL